MIIVRRRVNNKANFGIVNALKTPFKKYGEYIVNTTRNRVGRAADNVISKNRDVLKKHYPDGLPNDFRDQVINENLKKDRLYNWMKDHPTRAGMAFGGVPLAATVVGGTMFVRRRKTKNGKVVVENVRRKP